MSAIVVTGHRRRGSSNRLLTVSRLTQFAVTLKLEVRVYMRAMLRPSKASGFLNNGILCSLVVVDKNLISLKGG